MATGAFAIFLGALSLVFSFFDARNATTFRVLCVPLAALGIGELLWGVNIVLPRGLKADPTSVSLRFMSRQAMVRAELAQILRGMAFVGGRGGGTPTKAYLFVRKDRTIAMTIASTWFTDADMEAFAKRLGVPLRGDYTTFAGDRLPPG